MNEVITRQQYYRLRDLAVLLFNLKLISYKTFWNIDDTLMLRTCWTDTE